MKGAEKLPAGESRRADISNYQLFAGTGAWKHGV